MNRRSFLTEIFKGVIVSAAAPQIVTHGLHLRRRLVEPVRLGNYCDFWLTPGFWTHYYSEEYVAVLRGNLKRFYTLEGANPEIDRLTSKGIKAE